MMEPNTAPATQPASPVPGAPPAGKKPYTRPALLALAPLEAMANVCDPLGGGKSAFEGCMVINS
jgi:hypothetical protein